MNWLLLFRLAFLLLTIAWSVQPALALKVATPTESLNWAVADSDVIVRGRIVGSYDSVPPEDAPTGARAYRHFTVKVTEALKGETSSTIKFCAELLYELYTLPWMENPSPREEMLFFLISAEKLKKRTELSSPEPLVLRYGEGSFVIWAFPLSRPQRYPREHRVYDLFFRRLTQTDEIIAATRDALKARLVAPDAVRVRMPDPGSPDSWEMLIVPADARLELLARGWVHHPVLRPSALRALSFFPCDHNAELLKSYLHDPWVYNKYHSKWETLFYPLRREAFETLEKWGYDVPEPVMEEMVYFEPLHRAARPMGALALLLLVSLAPRRGARLAMLSGGLFALLAFSWVWSRWSVQELVLSRGSNTFEAGTYGDGIRIRKLLDWPVRVPLSYGAAAPDQPRSWPPWDVPEKGAPVTTRKPGGIVISTGQIVLEEDVWGVDDLYSYQMHTIPYPIPLLLTGLFPAFWITRRVADWRRKSHRLVYGLCSNCGYDLRANDNGRCPECGTRFLPARTCNPPASSDASPTPPPPAAHIAG